MEVFTQRGGKQSVKVWVFIQVGDEGGGEEWWRCSSVVVFSASKTCGCSYRVEEDGLPADIREQGRGGRSRM